MLHQIILTEPFLQDLDTCNDLELRAKIEDRLHTLATQVDDLPISATLRYYRPNFIVMKFFGKLNSRIIIEKRRVKKVTFLFVRRFFDKQHYGHWRKVIEPEISAGLWELLHPLSKNELELAFQTYEQDREILKKYHQKRVQTQEIPHYMLRWFEEDWYRQLSYKS